MATASVLEDAITCCICMNVYHDPYALPCLHTLCRSCISQLEVAGSIQCPTCSEISDITAIRKDFRTQTLIDDYNSRQKQQCGMCSKSELAAHCTECDMYLCIGCERKHQKIKICANHTVQQLTDTKNAKSKVEEGVNQLKKIKSEMSCKSDKITDNIKSINDQQEKDIEKTNKHFDKLIQTIQTKREVFIQGMKAANLATIQNLSESKQVYLQIEGEIQSSIKMLEGVLVQNDLTKISEMSADMDIRMQQGIDSIRLKVLDWSVVTPVKVIARDSPLDTGIHLQMKKPKGRMSGYTYFSQTCREEEQNRNPGAKVDFSELSKKCSEKWKSLAAEDKKSFEDMAAKDKIRYDKEMANYVPPEGDKGVKRKDDTSQAATSARDSPIDTGIHLQIKKPKGRMSGYTYFSQTCREEEQNRNPGAKVDFSELSKKCSEKWKSLAAEDKKRFEDMAAKDKIRYDKEMANYVPSEGDKGVKRKDDTSQAGASPPKKSKAVPKE